ncbi:hypothetical protein [Natrinema sp. 74]|uniref:hypothetical protein n=1 Tax=Natrinema sp. 74 TaxID=3384159 RepID=UPI0038D50B31
MAYDGLTDEEDPDLDSHRLGNFKQGWTCAVEGQEYNKVLDELKWNNLGWRLGTLFDDTSEEMKEELFEWCVRQQKENTDHE